MFVIKNRMVLGFISGIIIAFLGGGLNTLEYKLGLIDLKYNQIAAALFLPKSIKKPKAELLGSIIRYVIIGFIGTFMCFMLSFSGRKYAALKSIGLTTVTWFLAVEFIPKFILKIRIRKPLYHYLSYLDHILSAYFMVKLILKFGDKSLFP